MGKVNITDLAAWCKIDYYCCRDYGDELDGYYTCSEDGGWGNPNPLRWSKHLYLNGMEVTDLVIPDTVTEIAPYAFAGCQGFKSITISNSVTTIGHAAFSYCRGVQLLTISASVDSIASHAFNSCVAESVNLISLEAWCKVKLPKDGWFWESYGFENYYHANPLHCAEHLLLNGVEVHDLVIPNTVTKINAGCFDGCRALTSVTVPNSVTEVCEFAFAHCYNLTEIIVDANLISKVAFGYCWAPSDGVTSTRPKSVTIGNSVKKIVASAFNECNISRVDVRMDIEAWCDIDIEYGLSSKYALFPTPHSFCLNGEEVTDLVIPSSVRKIRDYAFANCAGLTSIDIPTSVTTIGEGVFSGCTGLTSIDIPTSVTTIGEGAFSGCTGLTSIDIPTSVTTIGKGSFKNCTGLTSIDIPTSVTTIGEGAFSGCTGLTTIDIPESVTEIGLEAFCNCWRLTSIEIPASVTKIGGRAFIGCHRLEKAVINDLAAWCRINFEYCDSNPLSLAHHLYLIGIVPMSSARHAEAGEAEETEITDLHIPETVTSVSDYAFYGCSGLTSLTVPGSVATIGNSTFSGVTFNSIMVDNAVPPQISQSTFSDYSATLYVPKGAEESYRQDDVWGKFTDIKTIDVSGIQDDIADSQPTGSINVVDGRLIMDGLAASTQVTVYTLSGAAVYSGKPETLTLAPGIYIVRASGNAVKVKI